MEMQGTRQKLLCIFTYILGGNTFSRQLEESLKEDFDLEIISVHGKDYASKSSSLFHLVLDKINWFIPARRIKDAVDAADIENYAAVLIQSMDLLPAARSLYGKSPILLFHDSTIHLARDLARNQKSAVRRLATDVLHPFRYLYIKWCCRYVGHFFPRTKLCADSLVKYYEVGKDKISVMPAGIDLNTWKHASKPDRKLRGTQITCLFVGGEFLRKGGDFLLSCFNDKRMESVKLLIVSGDPILKSTNIPDNVEWLSDITNETMERKLFQYQVADLFLFPTRFDMMGLVLVEASAAGLAIIARDVGGVSEIVCHGHNGILIPENAGKEEWIKEILDLTRDRERLIKFGENSRRLAEQKLSKARMRKGILKALETLVPD